MMNHREWKDSQGLHPPSAYRQFRDGVLPVPARKMGKLILARSLDQPRRHAGAVAIYARGSSSDQRGDLESQVARVTTWATSNGYAITRVVSEVGSGVNEKCRKFLALLSDPGVTTIVVEHRDGFARCGSEYMAATLEASGRQLVVVDNAEADDDLVRDMTEVLTSFCARLYGKRAAAHRAARALAAAHESADVA